MQKATAKAKRDAEKTKWKHCGMVIRLTPSNAYQVDAMRNGTRTRKNFETLEAAQFYIETNHAERDRLGVLAVRLTPRQIEDAADALHVLSEAGLSVSLLELARAHVAGMRNDTLPTVAEVYAACIRDLTHPKGGGAAARPATIGDKAKRLRTFLEAYGDCSLNQITAETVAVWLDGLGVQGRNRRNYEIQVQSLFNFAAATVAGYTNAAALFPQVRKGEIKPAAIVTAKTARGVLHAMEAKDPRAALAVALGLFAGLRTDEIVGKGAEGLNWQDIDFAEGKIIVRAELAKTRKARSVTICPALLEWLLRYRQAEGRISYREKAVRVHRQAACKGLGVRWPHNGARHSFATYHARLNGLRNTADVLGHRGGIDMLQDHYEGRTVTKAEAEAFFRILPRQAEAGNVIPLEAAG